MSDDMKVSIGAQLDGLLLGMKEATASVRESAEQMKSSLESVNSAVRGLQDIFLGFTALLAGGELFEHVMESSSQFAAQLEVMHEETGFSVEALSELKFAADLSHISLEELNNGLTRFARNIYNAGTTTSTATQALQDLNLRTTDTDGHLRPMSDVLLDVAARFRELPDGVQKTGIAVELFGRAGAQLIPFLNQGRDGIQALMEKAKELGVSLDDQGVRTLLEYEDSMKEVHAVVQGLEQQMAIALAPALTDVANAFVEGAQTGGAFKGIMDVVGDAVRLVAGSLIEIYGTLRAISAVKDVLNVDDWKRAAKIMEETGIAVRRAFGTPLPTDPKESPIVQHPGGVGDPAGGRNGEAIADRQIQQARDTALGLLQAERDGVQRRLALKEISAAEADDLERDIADREYQVKKKSLEAELALAKDDVKHQEQIKDQLIQLETQHTHEISSLTTQLMANIKGQWDGYLAKVKSTFDQVHLVSKNAFANVVFESAKAGIQMLAAHKATELAKAEATGESVAARIGFEIGGAIHSIAIHIGAALKHLAISTAEIVTGTWAWLSNMLGPYAAPVAIGVGAGALALGLSMLPSAAGGFDIPGGTNPLTQLHEREMVLPAELADKIRGMTDGGGGGDHFHIYAMDSQSFVEFAKRNPDGFGHGIAGAIKNNHGGLRRALGKPK